MGDRGEVFGTGAAAWPSGPASVAEDRELREECAGHLGGEGDVLQHELEGERRVVVSLDDTDILKVGRARRRRSSRRRSMLRGSTRLAPQRVSDSATATALTAPRALWRSLIPVARALGPTCIVKVPHDVEERLDHRHLGPARRAKDLARLGLGRRASMGVSRWWIPARRRRPVDVGHGLTVEQSQVTQAAPRPGRRPEVRSRTMASLGRAVKTTVDAPATSPAEAWGFDPGNGAARSIAAAATSWTWIPPGPDFGHWGAPCGQAHESDLSRAYWATLLPGCSPRLRPLPGSGVGDGPLHALRVVRGVADTVAGPGPASRELDPAEPYPDLFVHRADFSAQVIRTPPAAAHPAPASIEV